MRLNGRTGVDLTAGVVCGMLSAETLNASAEEFVKPGDLLLAMLDEAYEQAAWHGPNLKQSLKGVTVEQAAWRPGPERYNIWEEALHAAYWKYVARRRIEGGKRGSFPLKGSNFFVRPEEGRSTESAWQADRALLEKEHRALRAAVARTVETPRATKGARLLYGVALHDTYHAGQIRLIRRWMERA